ncbi:F-box protein At5g49610-like [Miscanthus floridulus]|uniref:F-box protein At5g49610-like n=1 Tax=Miscanthus floridulus TaxID=154761 RepID=UPI0034574A17
MPQTVFGFFYDGFYDQQNFISISGVYPSLSFLPFTMNNVAVLDCCNSLIFCRCLGADGYCYVICNPATQKFKKLPPRIHSVGETRLRFDPIASSYFHVLEYMEENGQYVGADIYSSKTAAWIFKESKWVKNAQLTFSKIGTMFLNGCLHYIGFYNGYHLILAVDMEGKTWRKFPN